MFSLIESPQSYGLFWCFATGFQDKTSAFCLGSKPALFQGSCGFQGWWQSAIILLHPMVFPHLLRWFSPLFWMCFPCFSMIFDDGSHGFPKGAWMFSLIESPQSSGFFLVFCDRFPKLD